MITLYVRPGDEPIAWNGEHCYQPGARCTHRGKLWEAANTGVHNAALEPGGFAPFYWTEVKDADD